MTEELIKDNLPKEKYRELCKRENAIPIFSKDWWLDAVCGENNWDVVLAENNGEIIASMPYYIQKKFGMQFIRMPGLTQHMGIWIKYNPLQSYRNRLSFENQVISELIDKLPSFSSLSQSLHYSTTNWLPFYWKGFKQTTRYTYVIEDLSDLEKLHTNFKKELRRDIKIAKGQIEVYSEDDLEKFYQISGLSYKRQNLNVPYSFSFLERIENVCKNNNCRKMFFAKDKSNRIHVAIYLVWDENSAYDLIGGTDPDYKNSNATSLITWEAIKYASTVTKKFDFEGSMVKTIERFIRGFGGIQKPYFHLYKVNSKLIDFKRLFSNSSI